MRILKLQQNTIQYPVWKGLRSSVVFWARENWPQVKLHFDIGVAIRGKCWEAEKLVTGKVWYLFCFVLSICFITSHIHCMNGNRDIHT